MTMSNSSAPIIDRAAYFLDFDGRLLIPVRESDHGRYLDATITESFSSPG